MKVRKKNGSIQDFNLSKIKFSIECVSDEVEMPLTGSDVELISLNIKRQVDSRKEDIIDTSEIHKIVIEQLEAMDYKMIAKAYDGLAG
ncbi:MAG TPA: ATP cone domain-containing protein [Bacillota bacterium]|nr:ATP cone domain-containing protein [Bacillota bacterium]